jgi:DNA replication and repair protein RecF
MTGITPILLLDEIAAHLDPARRSALYERLARMGAQVWMSGADPAVFDPIAPAAAWFEVSPGQSERRP